MTISSSQVRFVYAILTTTDLFGANLPTPT